MITDPDSTPTPADMLHGLPQPVANPGTFEGNLEQVRKMADGMRGPRSGWRRQAARIGLALVALMGLILLAVSAIDAF